MNITAKGLLAATGADGLQGFWPVARKLGPYQLRLRYRPLAPRPDLWAGVGQTRAVALALDLPA